ncbi:MAG: RsmG family class I SAM-dependent methyltransferase, partial [bacterium]
MFHVKQHGLEGNLEHQIQILKKGVEILGLNLTSDQFRQFEIYLELLLFWNQRINLFSRRDVSRLAERHLLESLA